MVCMLKSLTEKIWIETLTPTISDWDITMEFQNASCKVGNDPLQQLQHTVGSWCPLFRWLGSIYADVSVNFSVASYFASSLKVSIFSSLRKGSKQAKCLDIRTWVGTTVETTGAGALFGPATKSTCPEPHSLVYSSVSTTRTQCQQWYLFEMVPHSGVGSCHFVLRIGRTDDSFLLIPSSLSQKQFDPGRLHCLSKWQSLAGPLE